MDSQSTRHNSQAPALSELAGVFFRIGNTTFGSGGLIVALLSREMERRGWLSRARINVYFTLARVLPGTNVFAFVASTSHAIRGWTGTFTALAVSSIPASAITLALTIGYQRWNETVAGNIFLNAAMSAIVGVILAASWVLAVPRFRRGQRARVIVLAAGAALLSRWLSPLSVLAIAAAAGALWPDDSGTYGAAG